MTRTQPPQRRVCPEVLWAQLNALEEAIGGLRALTKSLDERSREKIMGDIRSLEAIADLMRLAREKAEDKTENAG